MCKMNELKEGVCLKDEIRLLRDYTQRKLRLLEEMLENLTKFARDDLERIDELTNKMDKLEISDNR